MSKRTHILKALLVILPAGALGASAALAAASTQLTPSAPQAGSADSEGVAARLHAIRTGVSEISAYGSAEIVAPTDAQVSPTWWGNGGWGRWRLGWGNGGWGNGGWHNWHNGWGNGGWGNGGWHNFWHNW